MALIKVEIVDYNASYSYAQPTVDGVINTDEILLARLVEFRGEGSSVECQRLHIRFKDGSEITVLGIPSILPLTKGD